MSYPFDKISLVGRPEELQHMQDLLAGTVHHQQVHWNFHAGHARVCKLQLVSAWVLHFESVRRKDCNQSQCKVIAVVSSSVCHVLILCFFVN